MRRYLSAIALVLATLSFPSLEAAQEKASAKTSSPAAAGPVNINTATVAELEALPGIGVRTAELIVEHRKKIGTFKKIEELMNVKGIGEKSFLKIKPLVTVGNGSSEPAAKR